MLTRDNRNNKRRKKDIGYKLWASLSVEEKSVNFIPHNYGSESQTNRTQLENNEQTEK